MAILPIFALLPVGLSAFKQAKDASVGSQIAQQVIAETEQTDYPTLYAMIATPPPYRYFDIQGNDVTSAPTASLYTVEVVVNTTTGFPNLLTVRVDILK